jgi:hypothetical protein
MEREPDNILLLRLRVRLRRVLGEAVRRNKASVLRSHMRQCGEVVVRIFVTGGHGDFGGGGMPQRIRVISDRCRCGSPEPDNPGNTGHWREVVNCRHNGW